MLAQHLSEVQPVQRLHEHGRLLLIRYECLLFGVGTYWHIRRLAIWLGLRLRRAVFIQYCQHPASNALRMPHCDEPHINMDDYFELPGSGSMRWDDRLLARGALRSAQEHTLTPSNASLAFAMPLSGARWLSLRISNSWAGTLKPLEDALFASKTQAPPLSRRECFSRCSGYLVTRPRPIVATLIEPVVRAMAAAPQTTCLHVRTMAADNPKCFPSTTASTSAAIDAAFGNDACEPKTSSWRFKMVPRGWTAELDKNRPSERVLARVNTTCARRVRTRSRTRTARRVHS